MGIRGRSLWTTIIASSLLVGLISLILTGTAKAIWMNIKISGGLVVGGDVVAFEISPDGGSAVFLADARTNTVIELFRAPTDGGTRTRLSDNLPSGNQVQGFLISPDSQSVVYWTSDVEGHCTGVYAVPITGGTSLDLSGSVPAYKNLTDIAISGDSLFAVYILTHDEEDFLAYDVLWATPLDGSGPSALSSEGCEVCLVDFQISPTGTEVVYKSSDMFGGPDQLYRTSMEGDRENLIEEIIKNFAITPDGDWVVYNQGTVYPKYELFSMPIEGGPPNKLNGTMDADREVLDFKVTPNSQHVVYRADELVNDQLELFSVPVDGSAARVPLLIGMIPDGDVEEYQITSNSQGVVYKADQLVDERMDLGAVSINGGILYWLNQEMVSGGNVTEFSITPNSLGVVFIADKYSDDTFELFSVYIFGTQLSRLNADLVPGGDVLDFEISADSKGVVYRADQVTNESIELFAVPSTGGVPSERLNEPLVLGGDVHSYAITPDSQSVVYLADQETDGEDELFATFESVAVYLPLAMR